MAVEITYEPDPKRLVDQLVAIYGRAERDLRRILGSVDSTDFMKGRSQRLLAQVEVIVRGLKVGHRRWAGNALTTSYRQAVRTILDEGIRFDAIDNDSVRVLAERMVADVDRAVEAIPRDVRQILLSTQQDAVADTRLLGEVAQSRVRGQTVRDMTKAIAQTMRDGATDRLRGLLPADVAERVRAIVDGRYVPIVGKDGVLRRYGIKRYAELVGRTWTMAAANEGVVRRMERQGADLVQMSIHAGSCPVCLPYQGKVYSLSGESRDFPKVPVTLPIHPHCRHVWLPFVETSARLRGTYDAIVELSNSPTRQIENQFRYKEAIKPRRVA